MITSTPRLMSSRFPGTCSVCNGPYAVGARIYWTPGLPRNQSTQHAACRPEGQALQQKIEQSRAAEVHADFSAPAPEGLSYLPYQCAGIAYASARRGTLIADEMGLGKTIQAIGLINADFSNIRRVLVICPASLKLNWKNELSKWLVENSALEPWSIFVHPLKKGAKFLNGGTARQVEIINYDILGKLPTPGEDFPYTEPYDLVILDEAHYCKNAKAARTKHVFRLCQKAGRVVALSGTPIANKPIELWSLLQLVCPETWDPAGMVKGQSVPMGQGAGFWRYAKRYCNAHKENVRTPRGWKEVWNFDGASNLDELQEQLRATCMVRRLKADVLKELPAKRRQVVELELDWDFNEEGSPWTANGLTEDNYEAQIRGLRKGPRVEFEEISKVRHESALKKLPAVVKHVLESLESSEKIVIFAHHLDVIAGLKAALDGAMVGNVALTGDVASKEARQNMVDVFQTDSNCRVFLGTIGAAGVGLTLTAASHVIFAELDWVPGNNSQAEDRCHRIGQKDAVLVQHLVVAGSIDAKIAKIVIAKQAVLDAALDNETGVEGSAPSTEQEIAAHALTAKNFPVMSETEVEQIHAHLRFLADACDGAQARDGHGFNKLDSRWGKSLAMQESLTARQALAAKKMLVKYQGQLKGVV